MMGGRGNKPIRAHISTMGCPKNLVDSEAAAGVLIGAGCELTDDPAEADLLLVGACSFLQSSWRDTLEEIERLAAFKERGGDKRLVLMGCLPLHRNVDLEKTLPEVDHIVPTGAHERLAGLVDSWRDRGIHKRGLVDGTGADRFAGFENRAPLTPGHTAYVKIAEGCNRKCSFCAIPAIRGRQIVRPTPSIVREVAGLVDRGVKEVTLLSQDIVSYRDDGRDFVDLVDEIVTTGVEWVRVFYLHPAGLTLDRVTRLFAHESVVKYLEMPVQHVSDRLLTKMRRSHDRRRIEDLIGGIRAEFPEAVIRSEVIAGFPGETDVEFDELLRFVEQIEFDSLGVFPYSPEPGTEAEGLGDSLPEPIIRQRVEEVVAVQEAVSFGVQARRVGKTYDVLVDRACGPDEDVFVDGSRAASHAGRFYGQAPEIDGEVFVASSGVTVGEFVRVRITESDLFDLKGEVTADASS